MSKINQFILASAGSGSHWLTPQGLFFKQEVPCQKKLKGILPVSAKFP